MSQFSNTVREGKPVEVCGLTLHPIKMRRYEEFMKCKQALTLRMSTLPAVYATMPFLSAIFAMDAQSHGQGGLLYGVLNILRLSMDMPETPMEEMFGLKVNKESGQLTGLGVCLPEAVKEQIWCAQNGVITPTRSPVSAVRIDGEELPLTGNYRIGDSYFLEYSAIPAAPNVFISAVQFSEVRLALAEMNGEKLPDESENPELVRAHQELAEINSRVEPDSDDLISAVALNSNIRESELLDWTIWEFSRRVAAIDRDKRFTVNAIAEGSGATWKGGNPVPSWCFSRKEDMYGGFSPAEDMFKKMGASPDMEQILNENKE